MKKGTIGMILALVIGGYVYLNVNWILGIVVCGIIYLISKVMDAGDFSDMEQEETAIDGTTDVLAERDEDKGKTKKLSLEDL